MNRTGVPRSKSDHVQLTCPSCAKALSLSDTFPGQRLNCPGCGRNVRVPAADDEAVDDLEVVDPSDSYGTRFGREDGTATVAEETKTCPMCGGTVKAIARKCRYCGEHLTGLTGPDSRPGHGIWRDQKLLVMSKDAQLPFVCVKTNRPADVWLKRKLYWHSPWIYVLILISIWIYIIVALIVRQKAEIQVALCRERSARRGWTIAGAWLAILLGISLAIVGFNLGPANEAVGIFLSVAGPLVALTGAIVGVVGARIVAPTRITKRHVWLKGVHPGLLASLPTFPGEV